MSGPKRIAVSITIVSPKFKYPLDAGIGTLIIIVATVTTPAIIAESATV